MKNIKSKIYNIALVGCGRIAKRHADIITSDALPGAKLEAVCDSDLDKKEAFCNNYHVDGFTDIEKMFATKTIDIAVILTESGYHAEHTLLSAKYVKTVVVEKPMALTLSDANDMVTACKKNNVQLSVVKQNRFNVPIVQLRKALEAKRFGHLLLGTVRVRWCRNTEYYKQADWRGTWTLDGGVLSNQASHHLDMLVWMMGEVESVFAYGKTQLAPIEAEDTAVATIKFKNGALGVVEATTATRPKDIEGSISILGEKGMVEIGGFAMNKITHWNFQEPIASDENINDFSVNPPDVYGFGHLTYYQHLIDSLKINQQATIDGAEGLKSLQLLHAIYQSIETGQEVKMSNLVGSSKLGLS